MMFDFFIILISDLDLYLNCKKNNYIYLNIRTEIKSLNT